MEGDWRRIGGRLEKEWRRIGGGLEEDRTIGGGLAGPRLGAFGSKKRVNSKC